MSCHHADVQQEFAPPVRLPLLIPPRAPQVIQTRKEKKNFYNNLSTGSWRQRKLRRETMLELEEGDVTFFEAVLVWLSKVDITVSRGGRFVLGFWRWGYMEFEKGAAQKRGRSERQGEVWV